MNGGHTIGLVIRILRFYYESASVITAFKSKAPPQ